MGSITALVNVSSALQTHTAVVVMDVTQEFVKTFVYLQVTTHALVLLAQRALRPTHRRWVRKHIIVV